MPSKPRSEVFEPDEVVLRDRSDLVDTWSDEEVVRRWWRVCPLRRNTDGTIPEPKLCKLGLLRQKVDPYRARLSDISWFLRLACQPIARRVNQDDEETPKTSEFTSAFDRIRARWQTTQRDLATSTPLPWAEAADAWLAPVFLDERAEAYAGAAASHADRTDTCNGPTATAATDCNPIRSPRVSNKGFLPVTRDQYLSPGCHGLRHYLSRRFAWQPRRQAGWVTEHRSISNVQAFGPAALAEPVAHTIRPNGSTIVELIASATPPVLDHAANVGIGS